MSESGHGGNVTLKPIGEMAEYIRNQIPADIPENYALKPMFGKIADEDEIHGGVAAFRDFLYLLCGRLISDGHLYDRPPVKPKNDMDYPFIHDISNFLIAVGYEGAAASGGAELVISSPSFKPRNAVGCMRFLTLCGLNFGGVDLRAKKFTVSDERPLRVGYPQNPAMLKGLKALAVADVELRSRRYTTDANIFLCDYRLMAAEVPDKLDMLTDFLRSLPEAVREFAVRMHRRYTEAGLTCVPLLNVFESHFAYSYIKRSKRELSPRDIYYLRIWEFSLSVNYGYCFVIRAKNTEKYGDVVEKLPPRLQGLIAKGYGCDLKLGNERCQRSCQGFRVPLDETFPDIARDIEIWTDREVSYSLSKR